MAKFTLMSTVLYPQFWKQVVLEECAGLGKLTETFVHAGEHPTSMLRVAGFSRLATLSKVSDGMGAATAPENSVEHALLVTKFGKFAH